MIDLHVLGGATLTRDDAVEVSTLLAQPKRFALLVYLVLAEPGRYHRRDSLLLRFWPESGEERARSSLRTGLHFLRRALGADVLESRGADEVRVAPGMVACDVLDFEAALAADRLPEALALYRGPLLPGLAIDDAPGWDEWLDGERARLARLATTAAWSLADRSAEAGDADGAAAWGHRAAALAPDDEASVRRLVTLLGELGDRAGALRVYDDFASRLATEFQAVPSPQTRDAAARVRASAPSGAPPAGGAVVAPAPAVAAEPPPSPGAAPPGVGGPAAADSPRLGRAAAIPRRRRLAAAAVGLGIAVATVVLARLAPGDRSVPKVASAPEAAREARVAVLPFVVRGYTRHDYLGEGMVDLLSATLDGAGELRTVDPRAVLGLVGDGDDVEPAEARRMAERLGARYFVLGGIVASAERLQVTASLYDRTGGDEPLVVARTEGDADDPFQLVDVLTARLLAGRLEASGQRLDRIAAQTTASLPALKLYLQGRQALRAGRFDTAVERFGEALAADSSFALAAYRLSIALDVAGRGGPAADPMPIAVRHADRLPAHDRLVVEARAAALAGRTNEAVRLYQRVLALYPDDVEAWYQLGDLRFHPAGYDGAAMAEARAAFRRVLSYESAHEGALQHLARLAAADRDTLAVDSITRRALAARVPGGGTGDIALEMLALRALVLDDAAARARLLAQLARTSDNRVWLTVWRAALASERFDAAAPLLAPLTTVSRAAEVRADAYVGLAHMALAAGRPAAARRALDAADELRPGIATPFRVLWAPFPFRTGRCDPAASLQGALARGPRDIPAPVVPAAPAWAELPTEATAAGHTYLAALLAACEGRAAEAEAGARRLAGEPGGAPLAAAVRAAVAWAGNAAFGATPARSADIPLPDVRARLVSAELLRRAGRPADALRVQRGLRSDVDYRSAVYLAPARLRDAEILERLGRDVEAAEAYRRVAALWRNADPAVRPLVEHAHRRAAALDPDG